MLTKLNTRFMNCKGFNAYTERTEFTAKILLAVGLIGWSIIYWIDAMQSIESVGKGLGIALIYALLLAIFTWIGVYLSWVGAVILSLLSEPFIWLYRKICP